MVYLSMAHIQNTYNEYKNCKVSKIWEKKICDQQLKKNNHNRGKVKLKVKSMGK